MARIRILRHYIHTPFLITAALESVAIAGAAYTGAADICKRLIGTPIAVIVEGITCLRYRAACLHGAFDTVTGSTAFRDTSSEACAHADGAGFAEAHIAFVC